jgi:hypothetical protein
VTAAGEKPVPHRFCFPEDENLALPRRAQMDAGCKDKYAHLGNVGEVLMKFRATAVASLLCAMLVGSSADARGPYGSISIGNWQGGAYTNDQTGAFSHCAAGARYASGIYFLVTIDGNGGWGLGFMHEQWTLTPGKPFR